MKSKGLGRPARQAVVILSAMVCALASVLVAMGASSSQAAPGGSSNSGASTGSNGIVSQEFVSGRNAARDAGDIASYWTPQRMANAVPVEELVNGRPSTDRRGKAAAKKANRKVNIPRQSGKLFFSDGTSDAVCSATSARGRGGNRVLTAAHCMHTGPNPSSGSARFYTNFIFVPRYKKGRAPLGRWVASSGFVPSAWTQSRKYAADQGVLIMRKNKGKKLSRKVGAAKVVIGAKARQGKVRAWGYPAQGRYNGQLAWRCDGRTTKTNKYGARGDAVLKCTMNGGASGGPWLLRNRKGLAIWAVTSRRAVARPDLIAHPMGKIVRQMLKARPS